MRRTALVLPTLALTLLAGCGLSSDGATSADSPDGYPVHLANCGRDVQVDRPPQSVVSLNQGSTEILLSLGLAEWIVGTATWTDPVLESLADANADVPRLADNAPSLEVVLDAEPEFVTASFSSTLGDGGVATRDQFEDLGVGTYVAPSDCMGKNNEGVSDGTRETAFDIEMVHREIRELARIFDVPEAGEELVASLQRRLTTATESVRADGTTAMFWFANSESPYLAGCCGAPGFISDQLGLTNVFDDTSDEWPQINWEVVADRNPDVLVLGDLTRESQTAESGAAKVEFLESHPVTREMDAVKAGNYIFVTGAEMDPSLRTIHGVENVAAGLAELGLAG